MSVLIRNNRVNSLSNNNFFVNCFLGNLVKCGNRNKAYIIYVKLIENLKKDFPNKEPLNVLLESFNMIKPLVNLRVKKVAGISYQLPCPVDDQKSTKIAVKWFFSSLALRKENGIYNKMYSELNDILKGKGVTIQRKLAHEKVALDNRAFLFFLKR